jgi:hypothetical protein
VHQRLMPGHEKPTAGASEVARRKIVAHPLAPPASPSLDRIKICCEDKMVPLRVGAWPKCFRLVDVLSDERSRPRHNPLM